MSNEDDDCVLEEDIDGSYDLANEDEDALLAGDEGTQGNDWRDDNFEEGRQEDILVISPTDALLGEEEEDLRVGLQNKANKHGWDTEEGVATHVFDEEKAEESEEEEEEEDTEGRARFRQERVIQAPPRTQRQNIPDTLENVQVPVERTQFSGRGRGQGRWPRGARGHRGGRMNPGMQRMPPMQHQQAYHQQQQQHPPQLMQQKPQLQQQRQQQQQMQRQLQLPQQQMRVAPFQHQELNRPQIEPKVGPIKNTSQKILVNPHFKGRRADGPDLSWLPPQVSGDYSTPQTQHTGYQPPIVQQQQPRPTAPPTLYQGEPYYNQPPQPPAYYNQQPIPPAPIETWGADTQYNQYQVPPAPHQLPPQHLGPPPNINYPLRTHVPPPQQQPPIPTIPETWNAGPSHPQEYYHQPPDYQQHQPPVLPPMMTQQQRQSAPPNFGNRPPQYEAQQPRFNFPQQQPQYQPPPPVYHSEPDYSVPPPNFQAPVNNYPPAETMHPAENVDTWDNSGYNQDYYQPPKTEIQPLMHPPYTAAPHTRPAAPPRGLPAGRRQGSPMRGGPVRRGMPPAGRGVGPLMRPALMGQPRQSSPMQVRTNMQKNPPMAAVPAQIQGRQNIQQIQKAGARQIIQQRPLQKLGMPGEMKRPAAVAAKYTGSPSKQPRLEVPKPAVASAEPTVPEEEEDEEMREYRKRIEEQKRMREAILKRKEIARRQAALKKQQEMGTCEDGVEPEPVSTIATLVNRNPVHTSPTQKAEVVGIQAFTSGIKTVQPTMTQTQNKPQVLATRGRGRGGMVQPLVTKRKVVAQNVGTLTAQGATPTGIPGVTRLANTQSVGVAANKQPPQVINMQRGRGTLVRGGVSRGRIAAGAATRGLVSQKMVRTVQQQPVNASHQATRGITRGAGVAARGTGRKVILGANTAATQQDPEDKIIPDHKMRVVIVENLAASVTKEKLMKLKGDLSLMELLYFPRRRCAKFYFATSVDAQQFCKKNNKRMIDLSLITAKMDDPGPTKPPDLSFLTKI